MAARERTAKETGSVDTPLRVAPVTKERVKWLAGLLSVPQGDVVEAAVIEYIANHDDVLQKVGKQLAKQDADEGVIVSLRELVIQI
jgi:hypothetical protein